MTANISQNGTLTIEATTELESFALNQWMKEFRQGEGCDLQIKITNQELPEAVKPNIKTPPEDEINTNQDRTNSHGILIPSDDVIFFSLSKSTVPLTTKEITEQIIRDVGQEVQLSNIQNALNRLHKVNKVMKLKDFTPLKWFKKTIPPTASNLYATDNDRIEFAKISGFKTIDEAISEMGNWNFENKLKAHLNKS